MDQLSKNSRSKNMSAIRSKDMKPELAVRQLVHGLGYRYRLHRKSLPGKPDLVFGPRKKVIFVHGCFWHQHPDPDCRDSCIPKSRQEYWVPKLNRNVERDRENLMTLKGLGWAALVIWECEIKDRQKLQDRVTNYLIS